VLKLRVPVVVRLAQRPMVLKDIMRMAPGTILEFDRSVDSELDLLVNNQTIGTGAAVKVNEHFGLRIQHIGNVRQRINSLGPT
jgi:flagellar motor switch protein FliN/FliY